ncbi:MULTISPECIES: hypothetical protein [unclassified Legionella]|uniref:hypothetical protein n=1 Tax=unclassified Legionella TaxID=2622702 RepID=UPI001E598363|nr:hypothetical protein [Legionella sp. 31fI33]MCC5015078.1 hypothetical protein [Legionella sp. 31fI33]
MKKSPRNPSKNKNKKIVKNEDLKNISGGGLKDAFNPPGHNEDLPDPGDEIRRILNEKLNR